MLRGSHFWVAVKVVVMMKRRLDIRKREQERVKLKGEDEVDGYGMYTMVRVKDKGFKNEKDKGFNAQCIEQSVECPC